MKLSLIDCLNEVTARGSAPRENRFHFNHQEIKKLAYQIYDKIDHDWKALGLNRDGATFAVYGGVTSPITGQMQPLTVHVGNDSILHNPNDVTGQYENPAYSETPGDIYIKLNFARALEVKDDPDSTVQFNELTKVLRHELVHRFDPKVFMGKDVKKHEKKTQKELSNLSATKAQRLDPHSPFNKLKKEAYYLHPAEIKAYLNDVVGEVILHLDEMSPKLGPESLPPRPEDLLKYSIRWKHIKKYYEPHAKIMKLFYAAMAQVWQNYKSKLEFNL